MQLYSADNSNFGARVTIAARLKGVELERAPIPAGGLRSSEFQALNPLARIPVLVLEDGAVLAESEVIVRYLDDRFPHDQLMPALPADRARVNLACRVLDLYVMVPLIRLFPHLAPGARDPGVVAGEIVHLKAGLAALARVLADPLPAVPAGVSLAECMLAPALPLVTRICALLDLDENPLAHEPVLIDLQRQMFRHPLIGPILDGLLTAQAAKDSLQGLPDMTRHYRRIDDIAQTQSVSGDSLK